MIKSIGVTGGCGSGIASKLLQKAGDGSEKPVAGFPSVEAVTHINVCPARF
jgi:hypothetical protein